MNKKVDAALRRLNEILPLKERQNSCTPDMKSLHQQILQSLVSKGRAPSRQEMALHLHDIASAIELLGNNDMITVSTSGELTGAYPFSVEEREHVVRVNGHVLYAMCALDALAVAPMFQTEVEVISTCALTDVPVIIKMQGDKVLNPGEVSDVRFGITWSATDVSSSCADSLCREMVFLQDDAMAQQWLEESGHDRDIFSLPDAVEFAGRFFSPLLT
ncbi:MAG TPA: hypothetical protein EYG50_06990 [Cycloclasticus sp.]|jgi:mercuric reductase|nr:hypothetical protein [Cycloclasticus sp.]HIL92477.1 hypothetical protein [Cycloclasticus sp.]